MRTDHTVALIANIRDRAHRMILRELAARGVYDLAPSHGKILDELYREDGLRMQVLAGRIRRDKSTVTVLVNKLVELGYLRRQASPRDRRVTELYLTRRGRGLRPVFEEVSAQLLQQLFGDMKPADRESLVGHLEEIMKNLQTYFQSPRHLARRHPGIQRSVS